MAIETVSFAQIATAATPKGAVLYGLTAGGAVYEYNNDGLDQRDHTDGWTP